MQSSSPHQRKAANNEYYSEHYKPGFRRQEECTECDQTEDKKDETDILSFLAYFETFLFLRFAVIVISHFLTLGSICEEKAECAEKNIKKTAKNNEKSLAITAKLC